jgi:orotidine-5'-phosphate decarboxylase
MSANILEKIVSPRPIAARERLIVALDVSTAQAARQLVSCIRDNAGMYKVGLQLFIAEGPDLVRELVGAGHKVFLDLKLHDIPNTVSQAVKSAVESGACLLTVHASAGSDSLRAAVDAAAAAAGRLGILGVTVLTSFDDDDLRETGVAGDVAKQVAHLALLAKGAGCAGVVTSPRETALIRKLLGPEMAIVNPGVRPLGSGKDDQERTATPAEAILAGASHIVVGRPITKAEDPARAAAKIVLEMEQAQSSR